MKLKAIAAALALALTPGLASAMCSSEHIKTSAQCGEGQSWDATTGTCTTAVHG